MFGLLLAVIYLAFISLGLPDGLLGAAWPSMYQPFGVDLSSAGLVSVIISGVTVISALFSERLVYRFGTGMITLISVFMTAVALLGFSYSKAFWQICIWSVPYGLGAGSVDAALNNYVALHYKSRHMSWLHCFWGVGCSIGPSIMSYCLTVLNGWRQGYFAVFLIQMVLVVLLIFSLPLWKRVAAVQMTEDLTGREKKVYGLKRTLKAKGVKGSMLTFFFDCAMEQTVGLWAVSYLVLSRGISANQAASYGALYFIGIMAGRFISGFITTIFSNKRMIRIGQAISLLGIVFMMLPVGNFVALMGLVLIGLGTAPVFPCLIHATPYKFGSDISQAVIGVQMACAYVGTCVMPPVFGLIAQYISISLFPMFLVAMWLFMTLMSESTNCLLRVK